MRRIGLVALGVPVAGGERVRQRREVIAGSGVQREMGGLVDHQQRFVLVDDRDGRRLAVVARCPLAQREPEPRPDQRLGQERLVLRVDQRLAAQHPLDLARVEAPQLLSDVGRERPARVVGLDDEFDQRGTLRLLGAHGRHV